MSIVIDFRPVQGNKYFYPKSSIPKWKKTAVLIANGLAALLFIPLAFSLFFPYLIKREFKNFLNSTKEYFEEKKSCCLYLTAKQDNTRFLKKKVQGLNFIREVYPIIEKEVSSVDEIQKAIEQTSLNYKIKLLWLQAHANRKSICLSKDLSLKTEISIVNADLLKDAFDLLEPNCDIVIHGCEAGKEFYKQTSIARRLSLNAKDKIIHTTTALTSVYDMHIVEVKPFKVVATPFKRNKHHPFQPFLDMVRVILISLGFHLSNFNKTVKFINGKKL